MEIDTNIDSINNIGTDIIMDDNPYKLITRRIDGAKIRNQKKELEVTTSTAAEMNVVKDIAFRAGAIIYTHENNQTYFCLGVDTQSGNLTDFGGGVKKGETIIEGGLRELKEESLGVFDTIDMVKTNQDIGITFHCFNMAIMFIPLSLDKSKIEREFRENVKNKVDPEVCDIVWLTTEEFLESIHGRGKKLYIRVRRLLNRVTDRISQL